MKKNYFLIVACLGSLVLQAQVGTNFEEPSGGTADYTDSDFSTTHQLPDNAFPQPAVNYTSTGVELGFTSVFTPSRTGTPGSTGLSDGDLIGVNTNATIVSSTDVASWNTGNAYAIEDSDGRVTVTFEEVDLSGTTNPRFQMDLWVDNTSYESGNGANDRIYIALEVDGGTSTIVIFDSDGGGSGGGSGGDLDLAMYNGVLVENNLTAIDEDLTAVIGSTVKLIIEGDFDSGSEKVIFDNILFTEGSIASSDSTPPVVQSITLDGTPAANATSISYTVTFDENANNITPNDFTLTATGTASGTIAFVSSSSGTTVTVTINTIAGDGTLRLDLLGSTNITDDTGNGNGTNGNVAAFTTGDVHTVDLVAPTVSISAPSATDTNEGSITYTITYTDADAVTLANGDVSLNTTGDATGTVAVTGSGTATRTLTISGITGDGTIGVSLAAGTASDTAGNNAAAAGPSATFNVDNTAPTGYAVAIDQAPINSTNASAVSFTFSGAEIGASYNYTFTSDGGGTPVTGSGIIVTATDQITGIDLSGLGDGIVTLSVTLTDAVGNMGSAATDTIIKDVMRPSIMITSTESSPTAANPIPIMITFDEIVGGFAIGDLTVGNGTPGNFLGSGTTYTVEITPMANGAVTIDIAADVAFDNSTNGNTTASQFSIDYDNNILNIQDENLRKGLIIYPIPNNGIMNISADTSLELKSAKVFDITGKIIYERNLDRNGLIHSLDVSGVRPGVYMIKVHAINATVTKQIVIE